MIPVLYIAHTFSDRALRPRGLAPLLPARGIRPLILCAEASSLGSGDEPDRPPSESPTSPLVTHIPDQRLAWMRRAKRAGDDFVKVNSASAGGRPGSGWLEEFLAYPDRHATWIRPAVRAGLSIAAEHGCRLVFASAGPPSSLVVGARLAARLKVPLVCELRDLWVDNHFRSYRFQWRHGLDRRWERSLLGRARAIIVVTPPMRTTLLAAHPMLSADRVHCIPNGFDPALLSATPHPALRQPGSRLRIVFTGRVYGNMPTVTLASALRQVAQELSPDRRPIVRFVGWIDGAHRAVIEQLVAEQLAETVPPCSYRESVEQMIEADVLLLLLGSGPGMEMVMTSKIFSYLAVRRPVLAISPADGVAAKLLQCAGAGIVVDPDDPLAAATALRRLVASTAPSPDPQRVREALQPYAWPVLADQLASILIGAADRHP